MCIRDSIKMPNKKTEYLGTFETEVDAARAYDARAREYGRRCNFPNKRKDKRFMKPPARTPQGLVFERATIKLWLETRGSVCPLTGEALTLDDLIDDRDLRARIVSWQLAKTQKTLATSVSAAVSTSPSSAEASDLDATKPRGETRVSSLSQPPEARAHRSAKPSARAASAPAAFAAWSVAGSTHSDETPFFGNDSGSGATENTAGAYGNSEGSCGKRNARSNASSSAVAAPSRRAQLARWQPHRACSGGGAHVAHVAL